jgi:hypothetical protein
MIKVRTRLAVLLAVPALAFGPVALPQAAMAAPAAGAVPSVNPGLNLICSNEGLEGALCLQNNGSLGSLVANDNGNNQTFFTPQDYEINGVGVTSDNYPFNTTLLNDSVVHGRVVYQFVAVESGDELCVDVNDGHVDLNSCDGSQSLWAATGSGRLCSAGDSNALGKLVFLEASGVNSGHPVFVDQKHNQSTQTEWAGF